MELADKVVLVTGASMGIGKEIAHALGREGCRVVLAARSLERLREEAKAIGPSAHAVQLDVTSDASVHACMEEIAARFGRLDVVVNNAGSGGPVQRWSATDADELRRTFEVHVFGSERVMRAAVPVMTRTGGGTVVNFASTLGYVAMPGTAAYNAAKAAVIMLSQTLRAELEDQGIDVRVFSPPHTSTESGKAMVLSMTHTYEPAWVGRSFVKFLRGTKAEALPGGNASLLVLRRISPWLAQRIMNGIGFGALEHAAKALPAGPQH